MQLLKYPRLSVFFFWHEYIFHTVIDGLFFFLLLLYNIISLAGKVFYGKTCLYRYPRAYHVSLLYVVDVDKSVRFYRDSFGILITMIIIRTLWIIFYPYCAHVIHVTLSYGYAQQWTQPNDNNDYRVHDIITHYPCVLGTSKD